MYNFTFKAKYKNEYVNYYYTDSFYSSNLEEGISICNKFGYELLSVGYTYQNLQFYVSHDEKTKQFKYGQIKHWQTDPCVMSNGKYKTLKQLSLGWFKNAQSN